MDGKNEKMRATLWGRKKALGLRLPQFGGGAVA